MAETVQLIECPRDAWQGRHVLISSQQKIDYLQTLLSVGFHTIDAGSFVSHKAVPQLADTGEVLRALDLRDTQTKLLVILANERGAEQAAECPFISYWGYPLSVSETFQQRNTRQTIEEGIELARRLNERALRAQAELVIYISMGFGNPYNEPYHADQVLELSRTLAAMGIRTISLADTVGLANPQQISGLVSACIHEFPATQWGVHLHARPDGQTEKIEAAYQAGCRRFDGAIGGHGGCPFAEDELVGNIDSAALVRYFSEKVPGFSIDRDRFIAATQLAHTIFS